MAVTKRCIRCHKPVRPDGTCQNKDCVLYVPEKTDENATEPATTTEESTSSES